MSGLGGDRESRPRVGQRRGIVTEAGVAAEVADAERQTESALAEAISVMRSSPRAVSTSATMGTSGSRFAVSLTWSTDSTIASMTPPIDVPSSIARSSAHHGVPNPLIRTQSELPSANHRVTLSRAAALSFGATASSMSSTTMSARECAAGAKRSNCAPLTKS